MKTKAVQNSFKRYEEKYMLTTEQYKIFLEGMQEYMEPDIYGETVNCNIYYDTDSWDLIRKSIEKPVYKEKLRVRSYGVPRTGDTAFIELKKKYADIVYKRRITMPCEDSKGYLCSALPHPAANNQIGREIDYFQKMHQAKPKVYIAYDRISFAGIDNPDLRITFDRNIRFREYDLDLRSGDYGEKMLSEEEILMEIKIPGTAPLWVAKLLSFARVKPTSFSKYGHYYKKYICEKRKGICCSA